MIRTPQINLYSTDLPGAVAFYTGLGFRETFRFPKEGKPVHVELLLDGFNLGIADVEVASKQHGFDYNLDGRAIELVFWNDDTDTLFERLVSNGAPVIAAPHNWLDNLRVAWIADPDGNPVQIVENRD